MRFFLDNNLSPRLARALDCLEGDDGCRVTHERERFPCNADDQDWMSVLAGEGDWVVVTCDFYRQPHVRQAWRESGLPVFILMAGWLPLGFWNISWKLIKLWPDILSHARAARAGDRFDIPVKGAIRRVPV